MIGSLLALGYLPVLVLTGWWIVSNPLKQSTGELAPDGQTGDCRSVRYPLLVPDTVCLCIFQSIQPGRYRSCRLARQRLGVDENTGEPNPFLAGQWQSGSKCSRIGGRHIRVQRVVFSRSHTGREDQGLYATHGAHIANTGKLLIFLTNACSKARILASPDQPIPMVISTISTTATSICSSLLPRSPFGPVLRDR